MRLKIKKQFLTFESSGQKFQFDSVHNKNELSVVFSI